MAYNNRPYGNRQNTRTNELQDFKMDLGGKKTCKHLEDVTEVDYKDQELLRKFVTERGKILSRRSTYTTAKQQRQIKRAIRRARVAGLLP